MTSAKDDNSTASGEERILAAAEALFSELGFDAVSMNAIAERAGVSKANIFHHFDSKQALYIAVLRSACRGMVDLLEQSESGGGSVRQQVQAFTRAHLAHILDRAPTARLILRDLLDNGPQHGRDLAEQVFGQIFSRFVAILRGGQASGELRDDVDPAMLAILLLAADVFFFQSREVFRHYPDVTFADQPQRYSDMLVDIVLNGALAKTKSNQGNPQ